MKPYEKKTREEKEVLLGHIRHLIQKATREHKRELKELLEIEEKVKKDLQKQKK